MIEWDGSYISCKTVSANLEIIKQTTQRFNRAQINLLSDTAT